MELEYSFERAPEKFFAKGDYTLVKVCLDRYLDVKLLKQKVRKGPLIHFMFETDIPPHMRYLIDHNTYNYIDVNLKDWSVKPYPTVRNLQYRILVYDLETDDTHDIKEFNLNRILSIAAMDYHTGEKFFICYEDEEKILLEFENLKKDYDMLVDWNGKNFDRPCYDIRMAVNHLGFPNWRQYIHIDYMKLFIMRHKDHGGIYFGLNEAAKLYLGMTKISHEETFKEMYDNYISGKSNKLKEYNLRDIEIIVNLDKLFKFITLQESISDRAGLPLPLMEYHSSVPEMMILRSSNKVGCVWPSRPYFTKEERLAKKLSKNKYKGALVLDPVPGIHPDVVIVDFKALYNSIMQTFRVSPENWDPDAKNFDRFGLDNLGVFPELLIELQADREVYKDQSAEAIDESDKKVYDILQWAIKVIIQLFYGLIGDDDSRFYIKDIAEFITMWGRNLLLGSEDGKIDGAGRIVEKLFKILTIYGDTDSLMMKLMYGHLEREQKLALTEEVIESINKHIDVLLEEQEVKPKHRRVRMELQGIYKSYFTTRKKKRHTELLEYDPSTKKWLDTPRQETKGFEIVKRDSTQFTKYLQKMVLLHILRLEDPKELIPILKEIRKDFMTGQFNGLLTITKGTKLNIDDYENDPVHIIAAKKLRAAGKYIPGQTVEYVYVSKSKTRLVPEPVVNNIVPEISPVGLSHYWNKTIFTWLYEIMSLVVDPQEFLIEVGPIDLTKAGGFKKKHNRLDKFF